MTIQLVQAFSGCTSQQIRLFEQDFLTLDDFFINLAARNLDIRKKH